MTTKKFLQQIFKALVEKECNNQRRILEDYHFRKLAPGVKLTNEK